MKAKRKKALWFYTFPEQVTPNQAALNGHRKARYERKARAFKRSHRSCEAGTSIYTHTREQICTVLTNDVHHMRGRRGDMLMDDTKWLAVCRSCHRWIHDHEKQAVKLGLMERRA